MKFANDLAATHPMNVRAAEMAKDVSSQTGGRVEIQLYPNNQLGSDTGMLTQVRSGAIDLLMFSPILLGVVVPVAQTARSAPPVHTARPAPSMMSSPRSRLCSIRN